jgi:hypothetical protein
VDSGTAQNPVILVSEDDSDDEEYRQRRQSRRQPRQPSRSRSASPRPSAPADAPSPEYGGDDEEEEVVEYVRVNRAYFESLERLYTAAQKVVNDDFLVDLE